MTLLHVACPLCGADNASTPVLPASRDQWQLKQCARCGMVYLENPPEPEALEEEIAWEKTFAEESATRRQRNPLLHKLGRAPKALVQGVTKRDKLVALVTEFFEPGPVLDVGCAGGHTLLKLPAQYIPFGIEISHELSQRASALFAPRGGRVVQADALTGLQVLPRGEFSGVIMTSFLEHDIHARTTLEETRRVMRSGARLIAKVPNYDSWNRALRGTRWCGFRFPDHVNYFTPETLLKLLHETGFKPVRFGLGDRMPTSDTMWVVAGC